MPNIEIVGYENPGVVRRKIEDLIRQDFSKIVADVITTVHDSSPMDLNGKSKPYIRVSSTNKGDIHLAGYINTQLRLDVEWLHLDAFFEGFV